MSTSSEIYWPQGWSRERLLHASSDDLLALPEGEKDRMMDSLRSALGPDGLKALLTEMSRNYKARLAQQEASNTVPKIEDLPPEQQAPFLRTLRLHYPGTQPWGFVVFRTCCFDDEERWRLAKSRWDEAVAATFDDLAQVPGVSEARQRFTVQWVEERNLNNAQPAAVAQRYGEMIAQPGAVPTGLAQAICLAVDEASLHSLLNATIPTPTPWSEQPLIPFALAIGRNAGEDAQSDANDLSEHGFTTSFKVAVATIMTSLFETLANDTLTPRELSVGLGERDVWFAAAGRHGRFRIAD